MIYRTWKKHVLGLCVFKETLDDGQSEKTWFFQDLYGILFLKRCNMLKLDL